MSSYFKQRLAEIKASPALVTRHWATSGPAHFSDSEIAYLRQQVRRNSESALKIRQERGGKVNPRIQAARAAGAKI